MLSLAAVAARRKLVAALFFCVPVSLLTQALPAACALFFACVMLAFSGLPPSRVVRRLVPVNVFLLLLWITLPFSLFPEEVTALAAGPLSFSPSGAALALLITLKANALVVALLALCASSGIAENARALQGLGIPRKLAALLLITHANLERMADEYKRVMQAARLRGFRPATTLASYRTHAALVGLLLLRSWQRTERVERAMRLRSFRGRFPFIAPAPKVAARGNALLALCCLTGLCLTLWNAYV